MPEQEITSTPEPASAWGLELEAVICEQCDWRYLLPAGLLPVYCPHCLQAPLTALDSLSFSQRPELLLPFTVSPEKLGHSIQKFAGGIWFAPGDLNPQTLKERLQRIYLPVWLVDCEVQATWQAEAGFNYEVVSHQDRFDQNRGEWASQRITETRIRWEPRIGRLNRSYNNIIAPALEEYHRLKQMLGPYDFKAAQPYRSEALAGAFILLPDRPVEDAWPDAVPTIQATAGEECRQACQADHVRQFQWKAAYHDQNWTLLLLPVYTTYYLDDDRNPQPILIHGRTGRLSGPRRASMKQAQRTALIIAGVAVAIFILSLIAGLVSLVMPPLLLAAGIGLAVALMVGLLALIPIIIAWRFNRVNR